MAGRPFVARLIVVAFGRFDHLDEKSILVFCAGTFILSFRLVACPFPLLSRETTEHSSRPLPRPRMVQFGGSLEHLLGVCGSCCIPRRVSFCHDDILFARPTPQRKPLLRTWDRGGRRGIVDIPPGVRALASRSHLSPLDQPFGSAGLLQVSHLGFSRRGDSGDLLPGLQRWRWYLRAGRGQARMFSHVRPVPSRRVTSVSCRSSRERDSEIGLVNPTSIPWVRRVSRDCDLCDCVLRCGSIPTRATTARQPPSAAPSSPPRSCLT